MNRFSWRALGARASELHPNGSCGTMRELGLVLMLTAGCSVLVESDREQCKTNEDCSKFESSFGYTCVENFCVAKPMCTVTADCAALGGMYAAATCVDNMCKPMCTLDADCTARGGEFADSTCVASVCQVNPTWACVDKPRPAPPAGSGPYRVKLHLQGIASMEPMKGVTAKLCNKIDEACDNALDTKVSDDNGDVTFEAVKAAFSGYAYLTRVAKPTDTPPVSAITPTLYFFSPPVDRDTEFPPVQIATPAIIAGLSGSAGATQSAERGLILMPGLDCLNMPTAGLVFKTDSTDPMVKTFYSVNGLPSSTATETDVSGYGGFINAPPGVFSVSATLQAKQRLLGSVSMLVRPGAMTITRFSPLVSAAATTTMTSPQ